MLSIQILESLLSLSLLSLLSLFVSPSPSSLFSPSFLSPTLRFLKSHFNTIIPLFIYPYILYSLYLSPSLSFSLSLSLSPPPLFLLLILSLTLSLHLSLSLYLSLLFSNFFFEDIYRSSIC